MGMVDMAVEGNNDYSMPSDNPYGYGLCISLTEEQVEALGLPVARIDIGRSHEIPIGKLRSYVPDDPINRPQNVLMRFSEF